MVKSTEENFWENCYEKKLTGWDRGKASEALFYWLNSDLVKPCRILVPGCGNGYEVVQLAEKGFDVTAIDIASTPIASLQSLLDKKGLKAQLIEADFFDWLPESPFDVIYEQTSLCALPPNLWGQYEEQLHQWLKPDGLLLAQFMQTGEEGGPPFHCEIGDMRNLFSNEKWKWSKQYSSVEMGTDKAELIYMLVKQ